MATTRVTEDASNPGAPNGWCLRHYGFVGVEYPGLELRRLDSKVPLTMKFRVSLSGGSASASLPEKHVLVYTRNGKGYVHDNIQASVEAIRKMGAENGFAVDVTDDPAFFMPDPVLKQYKALVFCQHQQRSVHERRRSGMLSSITSSPAAALWASTRLRARSAIGRISGRCWAGSSCATRTSRVSRSG